MAYNDGFPVGYQPAQPQQRQQNQQLFYPQGVQQPQMPQPQPQMINPMIWVQGETGAKSYLLAPNTTLPLWDSERQTIYLKSADASGMPSMKILDYTVRNDPNAQPHQLEIMDETKEYVTKEEFNKFETEIRNQFKNLRRDNRNDKR